MTRKLEIALWCYLRCPERPSAPPLSHTCLSRARHNSGQIREISAWQQLICGDWASWASRGVSSLERRGRLISYLTEDLIASSEVGRWMVLVLKLLFGARKRRRIMSYTVCLWCICFARFRGVDDVDGDDVVVTLELLVLS